MSYNQTDFVKDRVAVEIQFGKYAFVWHDLFVKHLSFYVSDIIDVGVEVLPMKELENALFISPDESSSLPRMVFSRETFVLQAVTSTSDMTS